MSLMQQSQRFVKGFLELVLLNSYVMTIFYNHCKHVDMCNHFTWPCHGAIGADSLIILYLQNSHAICELGLSVMNQLTQKETDLKGEFTPVSLPPTLYKPSEKTEGDNSGVRSQTCSCFWIFE